MVKGCIIDATTDNWDSHFAAIIASVTWIGNTT